MTWIAPVVDRVDPVGPADERSSLDSWLDYHRATLLMKCAGLTGEQLIQRPVPSSTLSLLGLVRHLADVERAWIRFRFAGQEIYSYYSTAECPDGEFENADAASAEADYAMLVAEIDACRQLVEGRSLDETFIYGKQQIDCDLRWVYVHLIEEYARHNGHADLIRELVDGAVGE
jgi:uncharacterized damage-inducible protein DinB